MSTNLERLGDEYRFYHNTSDCYSTPPLSRDEMRDEMRRRGCEEEKLDAWLARAEVVEEWSIPYEDEDTDGTAETARNAARGDVVAAKLREGWKLWDEPEEAFRSRMAELLVPSKPASAADVRAWLRKNVPAGMAVLFVHPLEADPDSLDMLTVYGGGISEELLLRDGYARSSEDVRAAAAVHNAKALMMQLYNPAPETSADGVPLAVEARALLQSDDFAEHLDTRLRDIADAPPTPPLFMPGPSLLWPKPEGES
jgi:hypothetical protein